MSEETAQDKPHYEVAVAWPKEVFWPACCARHHDLAQGGFDKLLHEVRRKGGTLELRFHDGTRTRVLERYTREVTP